MKRKETNAQSDGAEFVGGCGDDGEVDAEGDGTG